MKAQSGTAEAATSVLEQYGPVLAALIALLGVILTLHFTSRRDRQKDLRSREDQYRAEARAAIAAVLTKAADLQRHGWVLGDVTRWIDWDHQDVTELADLVEDEIRELNKLLVSAQLLVTEKELQQDLEGISASLDDVVSVIHDVVDSFWAPDEPAALVQREPARWSEFQGACARLGVDARRLLRPTVRS